MDCLFIEWYQTQKEVNIAIFSNFTAGTKKKKETRTLSNNDWIVSSLND